MADTGYAKEITKKSFISPIRAYFLPRNHRFKDCDETKMMVADTPLGLALLDLKDVEY